MSKDSEIKRPGRPRKTKTRKSKNSTIENYFKVYSLLQKKPHTVGEIIKKTKLPRSTAYDIKDRLLSLSKIKTLGKSKFVDINYYPIEEEIENWLKSHFKKKFPPPGLSSKFVGIAAMKLQAENDEEFIEAFKKVCKKYKIMFITN